MARRWLFYLAVNVLVSAATMLTVLYFWDQSKKPQPLSVSTLAGPTVNPAMWTPAPPATTAPALYTVLSGDTLGSIAKKFSVSIEDLLAVNSDVVDPDSLSVGQKLVIPASSEPASSSSRNPTVTPQPSETFPWPIIKMVLSPGNLEREAVMIFNPGPPAKLAGWKIRSPQGAEYTFGAFSLGAQGAVNVHTGIGVDTSIDLYWGLSEPMLKSGDEIWLLDAQGNLRAVYIIP